MTHSEHNHRSHFHGLQSPTELHQRTIGLAGVFQAATLVKQLATTGRSTDPFFRANIESLFKIESKDSLDVYGGGKNLALGLQELVRLFTHNKTPKDSDIARYVFSLLHLERKLAKDPNMKTLLQQGIERAHQQSKHFSTIHENVMANLASIYTDTLSTFKFRIYVTGEPLYLNQTSTINKIRALLLSGVRAAVLWRQMGGHRWQLLISRTNIIQAAKECMVLQESIKEQELEEA